MKLKLPHKEYNLDINFSMKERMEFIDLILEDKIVFHSETMTVEEYFRYTWEKQATKSMLDIIAYYLTKENRNLEILSSNKERELVKGSKRHTTFSGLNIQMQEDLGLIDTVDSF